MAFKFLKKQTKSENHEICRDIEISYVEITVKNWVRFAKVDTHVAYKSKHTSPIRLSSMNVDTYVALFYEC